MKYKVGDKLFFREGYEGINKLLGGKAVVVTKVDKGRRLYQVTCTGFEYATDGRMFQDEDLCDTPVLAHETRIEPPAPPIVYTPEVLKANKGSALITFALTLKRCSVCGALTMPKIDRSMRMYGDNSIEAQMKRANIRSAAYISSFDEPVCGECAAEDKVMFTCYLCEDTRPSSQVQMSIGDPADYLCKHCYETRPAKEWDAIVNKLEDRHRYDWG